MALRAPLVPLTCPSTCWLVASYKNIPRIQGTNNISETPYHQVVSQSHEISSQNIVRLLLLVMPVFGDPVTIEKRGKFSKFARSNKFRQPWQRDAKRPENMCTTVGGVRTAVSPTFATSGKIERRPNGSARSGNQWELCPDRDDGRESKGSDGNTVPNWTKVMERNGYGVWAGSNFGIYLEWYASSNREQHHLETLGSVGLAEAKIPFHNLPTLRPPLKEQPDLDIQGSADKTTTGSMAPPRRKTIFESYAGAHRLVRGHDLRSRTFLVLFNDQNHTNTPGSIVDPVNGQVTKMCGKLPIDWFINVLVVRIGPENSETLNQRIWGQ
ncbi:hypothetical protein B0H13DRAFT_1858785 [Mycena leptocephala]|nr:hypothetical protein B0H13DRAFT_1858785 [Mycena leptocephala]